MTLDEFTGKYPPKSPRLDPQNTDELKKLEHQDGIRELRSAPIEADVRKIPRMKSDLGCHLWVFEKDRIPYILERASVSLSLKSGVVKHTNLTGGGPASCGGELWVAETNDRIVYVNGCSGRYGPATLDQLNDAVEVFAQLGCEVISFGRDEDADKPAMVLR